MNQPWHHAFSPSAFLTHAAIEQFLEKHEVDPESIHTLASPCVICNVQEGSGILLNDKSYLCRQCFATLSTTTYPEKYESARREYIRSREAWKLARSVFIEDANAKITRLHSSWIHARQAFIDQSPYPKFTQLFGIVAVIGVVVLAVSPPIGLILAVVAGGIAGLCSSSHTGRTDNWDQLHPKPVDTVYDAAKPIPEWDRSNQEPRCPPLRHFHDPSAELTTRDKAVLYVFDHWPGYPPFWDYLKGVVHHRDGNRCQVTGCPSRVSIHVHHKVPTSQGGSHAPDNLVCLCAFHHGLEPDVGHERVWGDIKNRYFTLVRSYKRKNPINPGYHYVKAFVRRLELVSVDELRQIGTFHGLSCPKCSSTHIQYGTGDSTQQIAIECNDCHTIWVAKRALTEETGPRIAEILTVTRNLGSWRANWEMFESRNEAVFRQVEGIRKHRAGSIIADPKKIVPAKKRPRSNISDYLPENISDVIRRVDRGACKTLNWDAIQFAHDNNWINDWENNFYLDTFRKRTLSLKQALKREQINSKVCRHAKKYKE